MTALRTILAGVFDALRPDATLVGLRWRTSLDMAVTLGVTVLAVALAIGYQVLGRWARRSGAGR